MRIKKKEVDGIPVFYVRWEMPLVICVGRKGLIVKMLELQRNSSPIVFLSSQN